MYLSRQRVDPPVICAKGHRFEGRRAIGVANNPIYARLACPGRGVSEKALVTKLARGRAPGRELVAGAVFARGRGRPGRAQPREAVDALRLASGTLSSALGARGARGRAWRGRVSARRASRTSTGFRHGREEACTAVQARWRRGG